MRLLAAASVALLVASCGASDSERIVVAAGTTIVDGGLVDRLVDDYLATGADVEISVVGAPTAEALELGARGSADLLITHQPQLEEAFLREHPDADVEPVFASEFLLVGPPAQQLVEAGTDIVEAVAAIAGAEATFVSRSDGSGTFAKERELWGLAGLEPTEDWYIETGQGMGFTLQIADQRGGFTIAEEGAFLASTPALSLEVVPTGAVPGLLDNPYRSIVVEPGVNRASTALQQWLVSPAGRSALERANADLFGRVVYRGSR